MSDLTKQEQDAVRQVLGLLSAGQTERLESYLAQFPQQSVRNIIEAVQNLLNSHTEDNFVETTPALPEASASEPSAPHIQNVLQTGTSRLVEDDKIRNVDAGTSRLVEDDKIRNVDVSKTLRDRDIELIEIAWDAVKKACGKNLPSEARLDLSFFRDIFVQMSRSDIGHFSATGGSEAVISGFPSEVGDRLCELMREKSDDAEGQMRILRGVCANSLEALQNSNAVTPEELADVAVSIIDTANFANFHIANGVMRILPQIRGLLDEEKSHDKGWHISLIGLGVTLSILYEHASQNSLANEARQLGGVYYHEVLSQACDSPYESLDHKVIRQAATNLAATLGHLSRNQSREVRLALGQTAQRLRCISIGASMEMLPSGGQKGGEQEEALIGRLNISKDEFLSVGPYYFFVLLDMMTMSTVEDSTKEVAFLEAAAAIARISLGHGDRVASGFFNSGVTLNRMNETDPSCVKAQAILHTLGLFWALKMGKDVGSAMTDGNGYSCAINLLSKRQQLELSPQSELRQTFRAITDQILACRKISSPSPEDARKLHSLQKLSANNVDLNAVFNLETLMTALTSLILGMAPNTIPDISSGDVSPEVTASIVEWLFKDIIPGKNEWSPTEAIKEQASPYIEANSPLIRKEKTLKVLVCELYNDDLRRLGPFAYVDDEKGGKGLLSPAEWTSLLAKSKKDCRSIGLAFRASFSFP